MQRRQEMPYSIGSVCPSCGHDLNGLERCPACHRRASEEAAAREQQQARPPAREG
jgi:predicted amidophosphoribosyltransferase